LGSLVGLAAQDPVEIEEILIQQDKELSEILAIHQVCWG
jgi:hypothetical protein